MSGLMLGRSSLWKASTRFLRAAHSIHPHLPRHRTSRPQCCGGMHCNSAEKLSCMLAGTQGFAHSHTLVSLFMRAFP